MASNGGVASFVSTESEGPGVVQSRAADSSDAHVFRTPMSVRELAQMLANIDMDHMLIGSTLHFTQKTHGGVGMSVSANDNVFAKPTIHRLLETTDGTDWPFLPRPYCRVFQILNTRWTIRLCTSSTDESCWRNVFRASVCKSPYRVTTTCSVYMTQQDMF